jgi:hypothetical protein
MLEFNPALNVHSVPKMNHLEPSAGENGLLKTLIRSLQGTTHLRLKIGCLIGESEEFNNQYIPFLIKKLIPLFGELVLPAGLDEI